jgi:DnaK suppressor protein
MYIPIKFNVDDLWWIEVILMKPEKLRNIKKLLLRKLNELQFKMIHASFDDIVVKDNPADIMDKASIEFENYIKVKMKDRDRFLLRELQGAIMRIDQGAFGICEACGSKISERRLLAMPTSRFCMVCMARMEGPQAA